MKKLLLIIFSSLFIVIAYVSIFRMSQGVNPQFEIDIIVDYLEQFNGFQRTINEVENVKNTFNSIKDMPEFQWSGNIFEDVFELLGYLVDIIIWWYSTLWSIVKLIVGLCLDLTDIFIWALSFPSYLLK